MSGKPFEPTDFMQVGVIVKDVEKTARFYEETFGIGPFQIMEGELAGAEYHGRKAGHTIKFGFATLGPISLELIQVLDGETIHGDFLNERGEGVDHIAFEVTDLPERVAAAKELGLEITENWSMELPGGGMMGFAYIDASANGGLKFELIQKGTAPRP